MRELSLFTGAGGGILGTHLLGWEPIGYVEWDDYCQQILLCRIKDGCIPYAPIFGDIRKFLESGAAREYRGFADVVTAGFPCQPHSVAGKRLGIDDPRDMWPATASVIREIRPRSVLLENVPGILAGYAARVIADLAGMGYVGRTGCLSAAEAGAPHERKRWWIVAHADGKRKNQSFSPGNDEGEIASNRKQQRSRWSGQDWGRNRWPTEPSLPRVDDGMADWMDRIGAIGNGQVPRVVAAAWELLA